MKFVVTGGAGFIGGHLVERLLEDEHQVLNIDNLTYAAGDPHVHSHNRNYRFVEADINERHLVLGMLKEFEPDRIVHLAAESHVDRSIADPTEFVRSNIDGTYQLLEATRLYLVASPSESFRFIHYSTDEVFGPLGRGEPAIPESGIYRPSSPYSASKAASDHLVNAWKVTFGLPVLMVRSTNVFGPRQHLEKLIPTVIHNAIQGKPIPIYGDGTHRRDWLYVLDCVDILSRIATSETDISCFNLAGRWETSNFELAELICDILEALQPAAHQPALNGQVYSDLITLVDDRLGHDSRYALDDQLVRSTFDWQPTRSNRQGLEETVQSFLPS